MAVTVLYLEQLNSFLCNSNPKIYVSINSKNKIKITKVYFHSSQSAYQTFNANKLNNILAQVVIS